LISERWSAFVWRRRWWIIGAWLLLTAAGILLEPRLAERQTAITYSVDGSESATVEKTLRQRFPMLGSERDVVVFESKTMNVHDPTFVKSVERTVERLQLRSDVAAVVSPFGDAGTGLVSSDGRVAAAVVAFTEDRSVLQRHIPALQRFIDDGTEAGVQAYLVGYSPISSDVMQIEEEGIGRAELLGIPIAFVVLLFALGAVVAAALPLALGGLAVLFALGVLGAVSFVTPLNGILSVVVPMIGLGVGIDYCMFMVTRFREELMQRHSHGSAVTRVDVLQSLQRMFDHSGSAVLFSGGVVIVCVSSLLVIDAAAFRQMAWGIALAVVCALVATFTLLPAVLCILGARIEAIKLPWYSKVTTTTNGDGVFGRWARCVMRHPYFVGLSACAVLLVVAIPVQHLQLGIDLGTSSLRETPSGYGQHLVAENFEMGQLMPVDVVYTSTDGPLSAAAGATIEELNERIRSIHGVSSVSGPLAAGGSAFDPSFVSSDGQSAYGSVVLSVPVDSNVASNVVKELRAIANGVSVNQEVVHLAVGGPAAEFVDISEEIQQKLWLVIAMVLGSSWVLLTIVFRSVVLPLKAIVMNLLATAAAYGLLVSVFQYGRFEGILGYESSGTIQVYIPLTVFALLFGLSMDYEVFMVHRMREEWRRSHDNERAVAVGLSHTALPVTAAATIMVAVFGSFLLVDVLEIKQIGFSLAAAVIIDATLVRILLVPAFMRISGSANWWFPNSPKSVDRQT
jgi:RND superfamily putative drug exporter